MDGTCLQFNNNKNRPIPDFYKRHRYLSYVETEKDQSVTKSFKLYSIPYDCSILLLNSRALFGSGDVKICRYRKMLFNLYKTLSFSSSYQSYNSSRVYTSILTMLLVLCFKILRFY
jgi:hypothetical protein